MNSKSREKTSRQVGKSSSKGLDWREGSLKVQNETSIVDSTKLQNLQNNTLPQGHAVHKCETQPPPSTALINHINMALLSHHILGYWEDTPYAHIHPKIFPPNIAYIKQK